MHLKKNGIEKKNRCALNLKPKAKSFSVINNKVISLILFVNNFRMQNHNFKNLETELK